LDQAKIVTARASGLLAALAVMDALRWTTAVVAADELNFHRNLLVPEEAKSSFLNVKRGRTAKSTPHTKKVQFCSL
jgi:hypothetical protein